MLTVERIKEHVRNGIAVYSGNPRYRVVRNIAGAGNEAWYVQCDNGSIIGLEGSCPERPNVDLRACFLGVKAAVICRDSEGSTVMVLLNLWITDDQLALVHDHAAREAERRNYVPLFDMFTVFTCRDPAFRQLRPDLPFEPVERRGKEPTDA